MGPRQGLEDRLDGQSGGEVLVAGKSHKSHSRRVFLRKAAKTVASGVALAYTPPLIFPSLEVEVAAKSEIKDLRKNPIRMLQLFDYSVISDSKDKVELLKRYLESENLGHNLRTVWGNYQEGEGLSEHRWLEYLAGSHFWRVDPIKEVLELAHTPSSKYHERGASIKRFELEKRYKEEEIKDRVLKVVGKAGEITYFFDPRYHSHGGDVFQTPETTQRIKKGDCEDIIFYVVCESDKANIPIEWFTVYLEDTDPFFSKSLGKMVFPKHVIAEIDPKVPRGSKYIVEGTIRPRIIREKGLEKSGYKRFFVDQIPENSPKLQRMLRRTSKENREIILRTRKRVTKINPPYTPWRPK